MSAIWKSNDPWVVRIIYRDRPGNHRAGGWSFYEVWGSIQSDWVSPFIPDRGPSRRATPPPSPRLVRRWVPSPSVPNRCAAEDAGRFRDPCGALPPILWVGMDGAHSRLRVEPLVDPQVGRSLIESEGNVPPTPDIIRSGANPERLR